MQIRHVKSKKISFLLFTIVVLIVSSFTVCLTDANPVYLYQRGIYHKFNIQSPSSFGNVGASLQFTVVTDQENGLYFFFIDGQRKDWMSYATGDNMRRINQQLLSEREVTDDSPGPGYEPYQPYTEYTLSCYAGLPDLPVGNHNITIYTGPAYTNAFTGYIPWYTINFTVGLSVAPTLPPIQPSPTSTATFMLEETSTASISPQTNNFFNQNQTAITAILIATIAAFAISLAVLYKRKKHV
jgi:hypothetical protein